MLMNDQFDLRLIMQRLEQLGVLDAYSNTIGSRCYVRWDNDRKGTGKMRSELAAWQECLTIVEHGKCQVVTRSDEDD